MYVRVCVCVCVCGWVVQWEGCKREMQVGVQWEGCKREMQVGVQWEELRGLQTPPNQVLGGGGASLYAIQVGVLLTQVYLTSLLTQVYWQAAGRSVNSVTLSGFPPPTQYLIGGLGYLTNYSVSVVANNARGNGFSSIPFLVSTAATGGCNVREWEGKEKTIQMVGHKSLVLAVVQS